MADPFDTPDDDKVEVIDAPRVQDFGGQTMQRMGGGYATAIGVQRPRQIPDVIRRLVEEAALGGTDFFYGWGSGKDHIEGPSKELAQAAARCWGNCAVELAPVQETADAWFFTAYFIDLETGFTLARQFRQSKTSIVYGKFDEERKTDIRFQIGQSKATRNVLLNALPTSLINQAMEKAKAGVREQITKYIKANGIVSAIEAIIKALKKHGVTEAQILQKFDYANIEALNVDDIVILRGDLHAIDSGQEWASNLFPKDAAPNDADPPSGRQPFGFDKKPSEQTAPQGAESPPAEQTEHPTPTAPAASTSEDGQPPSTTDSDPTRPAAELTCDAVGNFEELVEYIASKADIQLADAQQLADTWLKNLRYNRSDLADAGRWQIVWAKAQRVEWAKYMATVAA